MPKRGPSSPYVDVKLILCQNGVWHTCAESESSHWLRWSHIGLCTFHSFHCIVFFSCRASVNAMNALAQVKYPFHSSLSDSLPLSLTHSTTASKHTYSPLIVPHWRYCRFAIRACSTQQTPQLALTHSFVVTPSRSCTVQEERERGATLHLCRQVCC